MKPIVWTIAGSDSSGSAGIQADLNVFQHLEVQGCSVVTAITSQNIHEIKAIEYVSPDHIAAQLTALQKELKPKAIKIGMLGKIETLERIAYFLESYDGPAVLDPLLFSTSGKALFEADQDFYIKNLTKLFPFIDLLTPNIFEAEKITGQSIQTHDDIQECAKKLLSLGVKSVFIKGGHFKNDEMSQDFWSNGSESYWLSHSRIHKKNVRGTGCVFSSAVAACLALAYELKEAIVISNMIVHRGIRLSSSFNKSNSPSFIFHGTWPNEEIDLPYLSYSPLKKLPGIFPECNIGLYPIVDSSEWISKLLPLGVKTIQLRIKNKKGNALAKEIRTSCEYARKYQAHLFINDHWKIAIQEGAYGVHLGQEDLNFADITAIYQAGLRLGISTHCYFEVAHAHRYRPSYIAFGPIYPTTSKRMSFSPQGLFKLKVFRKLLQSYSVVAIGGIDEKNIIPVLETGVDGAAMISSITKSKYFSQQTKNLLAIVERHQDKKKQMV